MVLSSDCGKKKRVETVKGDGEIVGKLLGESDALTLSGALEQILSGEAIGSKQVGDFRRGPDDRS